MASVSLTDDRPDTTAREEVRLITRPSVPNFSVMSAAVGVAPEGRARRSVPRALVIVGVVVALTGVALAVRADVDVRHDTATARAAAEHDRRDVRRMTKQIEHRRRQLTESTRALDTGQHALGLVLREEQQLRAQLASTERQLAGARQGIAGAKATMAVRNDRIASLGQCLNGVGNALNAIAVGDRRSALGSLRAVDGPCRQAAQLADASR
jgi:hypothetical protein